MPEEIKKEEEVIEEEETNEEEESENNDEKGEDEKEEDKGKEKEDGDDEIIDESKIEPEVRGGKKDKEDEDEEDNDDPDDKKRIERIVDKRVGAKLQEIEVKQDVDSFIQNKPEYSKYRGVIIKYASHPAYSQIPIKNIAAMVASDDLMKLGAAKERDTQKKVNQTRTPGTTVRKPGGDKVNWLTMSKEEFEAKKREVLQRPRG